MITTAYKVCIHGSPGTTTTVQATSGWDACKKVAAQGAKLWPGFVGEVVELVALRGDASGCIAPNAYATEMTVTLSHRKD